MLRRKITGVILLSTFLFSSLTFGQVAAPTVYTAPKETIDKIKEEGLKHSQAMPTLSYLTDVIGARLTNSPNMKRAGVWTRDEMKKWGMQNAHLEAWGTFGRGWSLKRFTAEVNSSQWFSVIAYPKAWSPSTKGAVTSEVVFLDAKTDEDLLKYKGQLKGKIVLVSQPRLLKPVDKPLSSRYSDEELLKLADAPDPATVEDKEAFTPEVLKDFAKSVNQKARRMKFLMDEGAAIMVERGGGNGGTVFVQDTTLALELPPSVQTLEDSFDAPASQPQRIGAETKMLPQIMLSTEDYNRLIRMIQLGVKPTMTVNIEAEYDDKDLLGYNTTAEIPGTDPKLKDEIVMLGGHLDSWHFSTGATDNAVGCAVMMEAARIIQSLGLKPRRTIRVALWSGEEQGLFGSVGYVKKHFGEMKGKSMFGPPASNVSKPSLVKEAEYEKLSGYYNLDNGTGKIRGIYLQGNSAVKPIFEEWLKPFAEMGAKTITLSNTGGTDHLSFDVIGLPGFQFIQDMIEYNTRTHHSNQDNYDRIQEEDVKQAATIVAAFVYQTAMMNEKLPRKPMK